MSREIEIKLSDNLENIKELIRETLSRGEFRAFDDWYKKTLPVEINERNRWIKTYEESIAIEKRNKNEKYIIDSHENQIEEIKQHIENVQSEEFYKTTKDAWEKYKYRLYEKDIYAYIGVSTLADKLKSVANKYTSKDMRGSFSGEYKAIYKDSNVKVIMPLTHRAACRFGKDTQWCSAARGSDVGWKSWFSTQSPDKVALPIRFLFSNGRKIRLTIQIDKGGMITGYNWAKENGNHVFDKGSSTAPGDPFNVQGDIHPFRDPKIKTSIEDSRNLIMSISNEAKEKVLSNLVNLRQVLIQSTKEKQESEAVSETKKYVQQILSNI